MNDEQKQQLSDYVNFITSYAKFMSDMEYGLVDDSQKVQMLNRIDKYIDNIKSKDRFIYDIRGFVDEMRELRKMIENKKEEQKK